MPDLAFLTTCMGRLAHLRESLPAAAGQPDSGCVLVDYSCPDRCGNWAESAFPGVKVVRVAGRSRWNAAEARNAAASAASAPWLGFFDADVVLEPGFADHLRPLLRPGVYLRPHPVTNDLSGTFVCHRDDFARAGGFDEVMRGWGGEEIEFYARLRLLGVVEEAFPATLLRAIPHGNDLRSRFQDESDLSVSELTNRMYARIKLDLTALGGRVPLKLATRQAVYAKAAAWVRAWRAEPGRTAEVRLGFRGEPIPGLGHLETALTYTLGPTPSGTGIALTDRV